MNKNCKLYLLLTFIISYLSFGIIVYSRTPFREVLTNVSFLVFFIIGCLGPFFSALIVYKLDKKNLRLKLIIKNSFNLKINKEAFILIFIFIAIHYGFGIALHNIEQYGDVINFLYCLPIMLIIMGLQEFGWRGILQPSLEEINGFYKSNIATGLIWALWFFPVLFIPNFFILPVYFTQFAAYLVGISFMLALLYRSSGNILYCIILSTLIFALYPLLVFRQGFMLIAIAVIEAALVSVIKSSSLNKNLLINNK